MKPGHLIPNRFAAVAITTLALGIGTSTAVVTVADALLFRPLPVLDEDRVVLLWGETPDGRFSNVPLKLDDAQTFQRQALAIDQLAYHTFRGASPAAFRAGDRVIQLRIALVSGNYFDVLGARPAVGRAFGADDDIRGVAPTLVLSHRAWRQQFGGDSGVIGQSVMLATSGRSYQVVGVMPPGLDYPRGTDVWAPLSAYSESGGFFEIASNELNLVTRLATGATASQARSELTTFFAGLTRSEWLRQSRGVATGFREVVLGDARPAVRVVLLAAGLLLLVACFNVANLLLARSITRVRELVVRTALGASRSRIVGHQFRETALLSVVGGIAGVLMAAGLVRLFIAFAPASLPRIDEISVNGTVLAAALGMAVLTTLIAGLAPAVFAARLNPGDVLRSGARHSGSRRVRIVSELLVATQVALAVVALSSAALVTRSLVNLHRTNLAFDPSELVVVETAVREDRSGGQNQKRDLMNRITSRLEALPEARDVTPVLSVPFIGLGGGIDGRMSTPGQTEEERARNPVVNMEVITPSYFRTLGTPILQGRSFSDADREGSASVVIVSASTARALWPGMDPIGKRLGAKGESEVVGVVPDMRYRDLMTGRPSVYFPMAQSFFPVTPTTLLIRSEPVSTINATWTRQALAEFDADVTVSSVRTLGEWLEGPRAQPRLNVIVLLLFAGSALVLAAIGLFSVMATMVRQRTRELGIRMALGATGGDVRRMVVLRGVIIAAVGTVAGIAGARATGALLPGLLYEVSPADIVTSAGVAAFVLAAAALASMIPARTGSRVEPMSALRAEG